MLKDWFAKLPLMSKLVLSAAFYFLLQLVSTPLWLALGSPYFVIFPALIWIAFLAYAVRVIRTRKR